MRAEFVLSAKIIASVIALVGWSLFVFWHGFNAGYQDGIGIVWAYETLGKCNIEAGPVQPDDEAEPAKGRE